MKNVRIILLTLALFLGFSASAVHAQQPKTKVTMGIHLDYFFSGKNGGIKAKGVTEGRAAQKAGVKEDDIILAMNETKIKGLFHYRDLLGTFKQGDKVKLTVQRGSQVVYLNLVFE